KFATVSCQITDSLLSCMKVNADIYCLHSASFQSHVKARESLTLTEEALLHNIRARAGQDPGYQLKYTLNPAGVRRVANPFRARTPFYGGPQGSRASNPGLKLANAFGVFIEIFKLMQYFSWWCSV